MRLPSKSVRQYAARSFFFLSVFLFYLLFFKPFSSFSQEFTTTEDETFNLQLGAELRLFVDVGDITLKTWDENQIHIQITKWVEADNQNKADKKIENLQIKYDHGSDYFELRQLKRSNKGLFSNILKKTGLKKTSSSRIDLILHVPKELVVLIEQQRGTITIDSLRGNLSLKQKKGSLYLHSLSLDKIDLQLGDVQSKIQSIEGNTIERTNGVISSQKGNLLLQDNQIGKLFFDLHNTDCYLTRNRISNCEIKSKTGDVFLHPVDYTESQYKIFSEKGDMTLLISESPGCSVNLETGLGMLKSEHSWKVKKRGSGYVCMYEKTNPAKGKLEILTDFGDIYIEKD